MLFYLVNGASMALCIPVLVHWAAIATFHKAIVDLTFYLQKIKKIICG